jgi:hypothetical protein
MTMRVGCLYLEGLGVGRGLWFRILGLWFSVCL